MTNDAISFSIVRRKVLTPTDFATRTTLEHYLLAFQHRYQALTQPFRCILIRAGRQRLLAELAAMGAGRMTEDTSP